MRYFSSQNNRLGEVIDRHSCPHCNKIFAFVYDVAVDVQVSITKTKPLKHRKRLLFTSQTCDRQDCRKVFCVEVHLA